MCYAKRPDTLNMVLDIILLLGMLASGIFIMYQAIDNLFGPKQWNIIQLI